MNKFQQLDVGLVQHRLQLTFRLEIEIDYFGLGNFAVVKDAHDHTDQFFDVLHHWLDMQG
ncbi:hypothetical protein CWS35_30295 [Bradyrhizobium sp. SK17]|nr:hypothetical protein CWS35_30295 [Bradyrhizobium sp. SK17]